MHISSHMLHVWICIHIDRDNRHFNKRTHIKMSQSCTWFITMTVNAWNIKWLSLCCSRCVYGVFCVFVFIFTITVHLSFQIQKRFYFWLCYHLFCLMLHFRSINNQMARRSSYYSPHMRRIQPTPSRHNSQNLRRWQLRNNSFCSNFQQSPI